MFSVLLSVYNKERSNWLENALKSISDDQTLKPNQIVLVKDGPLNAKLDSIIERWKKKLPEVFKIVELQNNVGLGQALNEGLKHCDYEIVVRMDTDDIALPNRFEKQIKFLKENPEVDIVGTWAKDIDNEGNVLKDRKVPTSHEDIIRLIWTCPISHPTVAFRKDKILKIGSYNTSIKRKQDYDLWFRAAAAGLKFANIPEFLLHYRFTDNFYKKNSIKNEWLKLRIGFKGLMRLKTYNPIPYLGVSVTFFRGLLPGFLARPFQQLLHRFDPRQV